ncbi:thioredoxin family protein [Sabulibacter ruber]|uniref:thioredoxin family protein n=1 Tax=Sabulibacter ruber TaxID=2811901 RepID=UPI001A968A8C|nr:thioredoxin family protein [Sabulibacter ruber]
MNYQEYSAYFKDIMERAAAEQQPPYDNPDYLAYTKLNWSRMNRWFKTGELSKEFLEVVARIDRPQDWIVITEPWCGDAAHNLPFLEMAARENPLISISYELRDMAPFRIEQYLTNGTRSIPKVVIRDREGNDLGTWGPRPANCQRVYAELQREKAPFEKVKVEIQNWYNANRGEDLQRELAGVLSGTL